MSNCEWGMDAPQPRRASEVCFPSPFLGGGEKVAAGRMRGVPPTPTPEPLTPALSPHPMKGEGEACGNYAPAQHAAWLCVCNALLNLDETLTKE